MASIFFEKVHGLGIYYLSHNTHFNAKEIDLALSEVYATEYSMGLSWMRK